MSTKHIVKKIRDLQEDARNTLASFREEFDKNPSRALSWSERAFYAAEADKVCTAFLGAFDEDSPIEELREYKNDVLMRLLLNQASSPSKSTSTTSNLSSEAATSTYARMVEIFNRYGA